MKVLALLLLCAAVAVQGRSTTGQKSEVALGAHPWLVHLRVAVSTSGYLNTGAGTLLSERWVLTSAQAVEDSRFIWIRFGAVDVISPSLVLEASTVSSERALALINLNRIVVPTNNIAPVDSAVGGYLPSVGSIAFYGSNDEEGPGEVLQVISVRLESQNDTIVATSDEGRATKFDIGAPLVNEGVLLGVLTQAGDDEKAAVFTKVSGYLDWIQEETGIVFCPEEEDEEDEKEEEEQRFPVNFAN